MMIRSKPLSTPVIFSAWLAMNCRTASLLALGSLNNLSRTGGRRRVHLRSPSAAMDFAVDPLRGAGVDSAVLVAALGCGGPPRLGAKENIHEEDPPPATPRRGRGGLSGGPRPCGGWGPPPRAGKKGNHPGETPAAATPPTHTAAAHR